MTYDEARQYFGLRGGEPFDLATLCAWRLHTQEIIKHPRDAHEELRAKLLLEAIDAAILGEVTKSETQPD